jgi:hypothetical protein
MALPHIINSQAGVNRWDPAHSNLFEVYFTLPEALRAEFGQDEALITEHVLKISGLSAIHKTAETGQQQFMGTTRTYINPRVDDTSAELSVDFSLNLRNGTDNFIYKLFKAWSRLGYDINTGEKALKKDYCADWLRVKIANRAGDVYEDVIFKDVMLGGPVDGIDEYNYETPDALVLTVKFKSDWWTDTDAA